MKIKKNINSIFLVTIWLFIGINLGYSQQLSDTLKVKPSGEEKTEVIQINFENENIGFLSTFVRTPFVIFTICGTLLGCMFSGIVEFIGNIFLGFNYGYPNTSTIWEIGWNKIVNSWWWKPSIWWHLAISILFWITIIGGRKH